MILQSFSAWREVENQLFVINIAPHFFFCFFFVKNIHTYKNSESSRDLNISRKKFSHQAIRVMCRKCSGGIVNVFVFGYLKATIQRNLVLNLFRARTTTNHFSTLPLLKHLWLPRVCEGDIWLKYIAVKVFNFDAIGIEPTTRTDFGLWTFCSNNPVKHAKIR